MTDSNITIIIITIIIIIVIIIIIIIIIEVEHHPWVRLVTTSAAPTVAAAAAEVSKAANVYRNVIAVNVYADPVDPLRERIAIQSGCEDERHDRRSGLALACRDRRSAFGTFPKTSGVYLVVVPHSHPIPPVLRMLIAAAIATPLRGPPQRRLYDELFKVSRLSHLNGMREIATRERSTRRRARRGFCVARCLIYMSEDHPVYLLKGFPETLVFSRKLYSHAPAKIFNRLHT